MSPNLAYIITTICLLIASVSTFKPRENDRLTLVENEVLRIARQNEELRDMVTYLKEDLNKQRQKNKEMAIELHHIQDKLLTHEGSHQKSEVFKRQQGQLSTQWVAFSSVIQQVDITNLRSGQAIVFDKVISNMGSAYDATSGIFTAPIRGLYVFNMDVMVEPSHNEYLEFVKDGSHVMYNYVHAQGGLDDVSSSRSVVLELTAGNQFWVRVTRITNHGSGTVHGNGFTTFSGYLLRIIE